MMQQDLFKKTVERLNSDPLNRVTVFNANPIKKIICNADAATLTKQYGSVEGFFEFIFKSGVKRIQITDRRSHGTTNIDAGEPYFFDFVPIAGTAEGVQEMSTLESTQPIMPVLNAPMPVNNGLNAGMNAAIYQQMDYNRVVPLLQAAEQRIKVLEEANKKMELELFGNKLLEGQSVAKTEANAKLFESLQPLLGAVAEKFLTKAPEVVAQGLTGAHFSPIKQQSLQFINELSDGEASYMNLIMLNLEKEEVAADIIEFCKKHKLLKEQ